MASGAIHATVRGSCYRGMIKNNNTTVVNVTDSQNGVHEDLDKLAGRALQQRLGTSPHYGYTTNTWDPHTSRMTSQLVTRQTSTPSTVTGYTYDAVGNITKTIDTRSGNTATSETQCFRTDGLRRLRAAWTATDNCAAEPTTTSHAMVGSALGAASAYWTTWTFNDLGDRTSQTQHSTAGGSDTVTNYAYNGDGTNQPHTLTSTGTGTATTGATAYT